MCYTHIDIAESMHRFKSTFHRIQYPGLSNGEFFLLSILKSKGENGCLNVSQLAKYMDVLPPSATRTLNNLEKRGYIKRTANPSNHRNTFASITRSGEDALENVHDYICRFMNEVSISMGDDNMKELTRLLNLMSDTIDEKIRKKE